MSLPQRIAAYGDCFTIYDKALASSGGARVAFATQGEAEYFAMRMQQARALKRAEARQIYKPTDKQYDKSEYDRLVVQRAVQDDAGEWWVYVKPTGSNILAVETLDAATNIG